MRYRTFGRTGWQVGTVGYGMWGLAGWTGSDDAQTRESLQLALDEKAKDFLVEKGYDPTYGARPMRRAVERYLEDPLAEEILKGNVHGDEPVQVSVADGKLSFTQKATAEGALSS